MPNANFHSERRRWAGNFCAVFALLCGGLWVINFVLIAIDATPHADASHTSVFNNHGAIYFIRPIESEFLIALIPLTMLFAILGHHFRRHLDKKDNPIWERRRP
jgi:hypothetical protein